MLYTIPYHYKDLRLRVKRGSIIKFINKEDKSYIKRPQV